jgi:hypothetical protein
VYDYFVKKTSHTLIMAPKKKVQKKAIAIETSLEGKTISELKKLARQEGIDIKGLTKKADILVKIHSEQSKESKKEEIEIKPAKKPAAKKAAKKPAAKKTKKPAAKPTKKPAAKGKKPAKGKKVAKKTVVPKEEGEKDYSKMLLSSLKRECTKKGLDCKTAKTKAALIAMLTGEVLAKKVSPKKVTKKITKKVTKKVSPKKVSPKKKASPKKAKKAARCDDQEDYVECEDGSVCNAATGRCIKDTGVNRKKYPASITLKDGRKLIGSEESIEKIREIFGDQVEEVSKRCDDEDGVCEDDQVCDGDSGECTADSEDIRSKKRYELDVKGRKIIGTKATIEKLHKKLGGKVKSLDDEAKRLKELLAEEKEVSGEAAKLEEQISKRKKKSPKKKEVAVKPVEEKKKESPKPKESVKVEMEKQKIYDTFKRCLESLQAS